jgi:hypothetical protein
MARRAQSAVLAAVLVCIQQAKLQIGRETPVPLIVIDTYNQTLGAGSDENGAATAGAYTANMRLLLQAFPGATVVAIHHPGANGTRERGSTALRNNVDFSLALTRSPRELTTRIVVAKMKNGANDGGLLLRFARKSDSLGVIATLPLKAEASSNQGFTWTASRISVLRAIQAASLRGEWLRATAWWAAAGESHSNFDSVRGELNRLDLLNIRGKSRQYEYQLNQAGLDFAADQNELSIAA